jgi:hypothetical protein
MRTTGRFGRVLLTCFACIAVSLAAVHFGAVTAAAEALLPEASAPAVTTLWAVEDAYVCSGAPTSNFDSVYYLLVGTGMCWNEGEVQGDLRSLVRFDLSELPAGVIESASLGLYQVSSIGEPAARGISVSRVTSGWSEGSVT